MDLFYFVHVTKAIKITFKTSLLTEGSEQKKKRVKADSEVPRLSPSMRLQIESSANLKGEQVCAHLTLISVHFDFWRRQSFSAAPHTFMVIIMAGVKCISLVSTFT